MLEWESWACFRSQRGLCQVDHEAPRCLKFRISGFAVQFHTGDLVDSDSEGDPKVG